MAQHWDSFLSYCIKPEAEDDRVYLNEDGQLFLMDGISNRDEVDGEECEEAIKSPPKGSGIRLGSEVCFKSVNITY